MRYVIPHLTPSDFPLITRTRLTTTQVNLGYRCNQSCTHCHVNAGPNRTEMMPAEIMELLIDFLHHSNCEIIDITGGAPELHPLFRHLVQTARQMDIDIIDRCNLTVLFEPGQNDLPEFLKTHQVQIIASLPCYTPETVDAQRGSGVFNKSIEALKKLNAIGYGIEQEFILNLIYNPSGAFLPASQQQLEQQYKQHLMKHYGISFNRLFTLTNMPIQRFGSALLSKGIFAQYMQLLRESHNPENLDHVMCRNTLSIDWRGYIYDCDFNQMLDIPMHGATERLHLKDLLQTKLEGLHIATADHCYGCTAGHGSSCTGALS